MGSEPRGRDSPTGHGSCSRADPFSRSRLRWSEVVGRAWRSQRRLLFRFGWALTATPGAKRPSSLCSMSRLLVSASPVIQPTSRPTVPTISPPQFEPQPKPSSTHPKPSRIHHTAPFQGVGFVLNLLGDVFVSCSNQRARLSIPFCCLLLLYLYHIYTLLKLGVAIPSQQRRTLHR